MDKSVLDGLLAAHPLICQVKPVEVKPDDIVHVTGTQEPVRDQPDDRIRSLYAARWLSIESVETVLNEAERSKLVAEVQHTARAWLKQEGKTIGAPEKQQVRWMIEKTRPHESKQQIAQRVWLALVLYSLGCRELNFNIEGQILWDGGMTARVGAAPDTVLDIAWEQPGHQTYAASFRQADGTIVRGKGRQRWHVYRLTVSPIAEVLFTRRATMVKESIALIVASETFATQPQLPRDFYGGDAFQQACIDAQDQAFTHILVLSPAHGVISLDDIVPSEKHWDSVIERGVWSWQYGAIRRLGQHLAGNLSEEFPKPETVHWWSWLNPQSVYTVTVFGSGFAVRILITQLLRAREHGAHSWPQIEVVEPRPGYDVGEFDGYDDMFDFEEDEQFDEDEEFDSVLKDIDQLLEWGTELASLVNVFVPPTGEQWELAPDEVLLPIRLLAEAGVDVEDLLDLLTDTSLLLERPLPISMLINSGMIVSVLLQITHSLVHNDRSEIYDLADTFPEGVLRQYVENVMQEPSQEDRLCACLTLAEQTQLLALTISPALGDQLLVWLQTYLSTRMRQRLMEEFKTSEQEE